MMDFGWKRKLKLLISFGGEAQKWKVDCNLPRPICLQTYTPGSPTSLPSPPPPSVSSSPWDSEVSSLWLSIDVLLFYNTVSVLLPLICLLARGLSCAPSSPCSEKSQLDHQTWSCFLWACPPPHPCATILIARAVSRWFNTFGKRLSFWSNFRIFKVTCPIETNTPWKLNRFAPTPSM